MAKLVVRLLAHIPYRAMSKEMGPGVGCKAPTTTMFVCESCGNDTYFGQKILTRKPTGERTEICRKCDHAMKKEKGMWLCPQPKA